MTVAFLINSFDSGGAEKQLLLTATGLARRGHTCTIITLEHRELSPHYAGLVAIARSAGVGWVSPMPGRRFDVVQLWRTIGILRRSRSTILWTWGHRADAVRLLLAMLPSGFVPVSSLRSADSERIHRFRYWWMLLGKTTRLFVSNSKLNIEFVEREVPGIGSRCVVIYNSLECSALTQRHVNLLPRPQLLRVLMLGNLLLHRKGYDLAVALASRVKASGLPIEIHVGGKLFEAEAMRQLISDQRVEEVIKLVGPVSRPMEFLSTGHCYLMLSRVEGTPNALLEALSLGLPAICTKIGDVERFATDKEQLRLVDIGDVEGAWTALRDCWDEWQAAVAMGERGRLLVRRLFTEERMIQETETALLQVLQPNQAAASKA